MSKTIKISPTAHSQLTALTSTYEAGHGELVEAMIVHFTRSGGDPRTVEGEGIAGQLKAMNKRLNQIIAFIQEHEKKKLNPLLDALATLIQQLAQQRTHDTEANTLLIEYLVSLRVMLEIQDGRTLDLLRLPKADADKRSDGDVLYFAERKQELLNELTNATR